MKQHNINIKEVTIAKDVQITAIVIGESGRGRKQVFIPAPAGMKETELVEIGLTQSGRPKIIRSESQEDWLAKISSSGTYTRNTYGSIYVPKNYLGNVQIIASGYGAYGDAGRIGTFYEFLLTVKDDSFIKIRPSGGEHKRPPYWLRFTNDKVLRIDHDTLDAVCDASEWDNPECCELVDLASL